MACTSEEKTSLSQDDACVEESASEGMQGMAVRQRTLALRRVWGRTACISLTLLAAVLVSGACLAGLALFSGSRSAKAESADVVADYAGYVPVFQQCGGDDYHGPKRCVPGCFCKKDNDFYSACKPPRGQDTCDKRMGLKAAKKVQKILEPLKHKADLLKDKMVEMKEKALDAKREYDKLQNVTAPLISAKKNKTEVFNKVNKVKESADAAAASHAYALENAASKAKDCARAEAAAKKALEDAQGKVEKAKGRAQFLAKAAGLPDPFDESKDTARLL